ncbi:MAG TPA: methyltransferase domain-containing protein [Usitatibacter sp.]|nr:methyltransferase domain-containing protein [Usitatibacter sp.]
MSGSDMTMPRIVEPEWLDSLPDDDLRARRSRRDLARVNAFMSNARIVAGALAAALPPRPVNVAEIGAGDGAFALAVVRRLPQGGRIQLLDRQAEPPRETLDALAAAGWAAESVRADVFDWLADAATPRFDAIFANLFLHHFEPAQLRSLLQLAASRARVLVACEPRRSQAALLGSRLLGLIGCNDVTRHDAVASVRAGFRGAELSALWHEAPGWLLEERPRGAFSHLFVAQGA